MVKFFATGSLYGGYLHDGGKDLTTDGQADTSFGNTGEGFTFLNEPEVYDAGKSVFFTRDKKIVLTGQYASTADKQVAAVQYNNDGTIDSSIR